jgi:hypothetical protein
MSSIFKGDSIYKSGGSGGFADGGQLPSSSSGIVEIKNNTIYEYNNTNNNDLTFVFSKKEDVFNSVIELTTSVNGTVYVGYINSHGLVIPLSVIGSTSISANNSYKINIVGDSYSIESVSVVNNDPIAATVLGNLYPCTKYSNFIVVGPIGGGNNGPGGIYWDQYNIRSNWLSKFMAEGYNVLTVSQWGEYKLNPKIDLLGYYNNRDHIIDGYGSYVYIWRSLSGIIDAYIYNGNDWSVTQPANYNQCVLLLAKTL